VFFPFKAFAAIFLLDLQYFQLDMYVFWDIAGAGFGSKSKYMFGKATIQLKLVEGDSAGTVTAFYVSGNVIK